MSYTSFTLRNIVIQNKHKTAANLKINKHEHGQSLLFQTK